MYSYCMLEELAKNCGDSFYIFDKAGFEENFKMVQKTFSDEYDNVQLAYAYKTNYLIELCKCVNELGGYAEICSRLEYEIALAAGIPVHLMIMNGPFKEHDIMETILVKEGLVNVDSYNEFNEIMNIANLNPDINMRIGIRCNFQIDKGRMSRFGMDLYSAETKEILNQIKHTSNLTLDQIHCHIKGRTLNTWMRKAEQMIEYYDYLCSEYSIFPASINLGGGLPVAESKEDGGISAEFAKAVCGIFKKHWQRKQKPVLFFEAGAAVSGNFMQFITRVRDIKSIRNYHYAVLQGNHYFTNPLNKRYGNGIIVYNKQKCNFYDKILLVGTTCLEDDLLGEYSGEIGIDDFVEFKNVGAYSFALKPPFIDLNVPIICIDDKESFQVLKNRESVQEIIATFCY